MRECLVSLVKQIQQYGPLTVVQFDFPLAGDTLPLHDHDAETMHVTIVSRGTVIIRGAPGTWALEAKAGQTVDLQPHSPHEIEALTDGARIHNVQKKQS
jgi:quercetin dioxygenase-like cupin family protein